MDTLECLDHAVCAGAVLQITLHVLLYYAARVVFGGYAAKHCTLRADRCVYRPHRPFARLYVLRTSLPRGWPTKPECRVYYFPARARVCKHVAL